MKNPPMRFPHDLVTAWSDLTVHALFPRPGAYGAARDTVSRQRPASLLERLDRMLWTQRQRDIERSLGSARDAAEVEAKLRARERGLLNRYY